MFEISKIKMEYKKEPVTALMGLEFHSYSPWKNSPEYDECVLQVHCMEFVRLSQLQKIKKLLKPDDILVHLNPRDEPIGADYISLLFRKDSPPSDKQMEFIKSMKKYCHGVEPETSLE